jgi:hypothetical protein
MNNCFVKVGGGLGNQLFQVAAAYSYCKKYNKKLYIDISDWSASQGNNPTNYKNSIFKNFEYHFYSTPETTQINEDDLVYKELPFYDGDVSLHGYFQSEKYFREYKQEFINLLNLPDVNKSFMEEQNVAFHIRRGDYISYSHIYNVCNTDYFNKQFKAFKNYQINVFTDSANIICEEFKNENFNLIITNSELEDLTLMSLHTNIVCSNSSFSWWASLLGKRKDNIIVPNRWFNNLQNHYDIYRSEFTKIEV